MTTSTTSRVLSVPDLRSQFEGRLLAPDDEGYDDACVTTYIQKFGRAAFRRDLSDEEVQQWLGVARNAAMLAGTAAYGLQTATSGLVV